MGVVYLATDPRGQKVAVKALRQPVAADPHARSRLAREVETMHRVASPFVAEVIDADVGGDQPYIVTRYVDGRTLEDLVGESGPLAGEALARVAYGLASALTAVHAAGVVHRDLKPGNVMMADGRPVVIDFGIAQAPDLTRLTMTGMFMGTPGYLAPEVIEGQPSGPSADVHSWGATVAFAATGRPPFGTGSFESIFYRIVHGQPDLDRFSPPLVPLVAHALARDPARRPSAADLTARLAVIDPAALVPGPAAPVMPPGRPSPGTLADQRGGPGAGGAAVPAAVIPAGLPGAGPGAGLAAAAIPAPQPADYRGMLPAAQYGPPPPPDWMALPPGAAGSPAGQAGARGTARIGPLLAAATVVAAACVSVLLPLAGLVASLIALLLLRSGSLTGVSVARRRSVRGSRATDPMLAAVYFPTALLRSLVGMALLAVPAAIFGGIVGALTLLVNPAHPVAQAGAYAAGAIVIFYGLGPGSASTRRPLVQFFNALGRTPPSGFVVLIAVCAIALGAVAAAATHPPYYWPSGNVTTRFQSWPRLPGLLHEVRAAVVRLIGKQA